jgi:L-arabinokinase
MQTFKGTATGRMDVMGGIADYSGSLVLQKPIREKTTVTITLRQDGIFRLESHLPEGEIAYFETHYHTLWQPEQIDYADIQKKLLAQKGGNWASYVIGCFVVLAKEKDIIVSGANITIHSEVPTGKGVSSSAALEIATMRALQQAYNIPFDGTELAVLAQKVENLIVGAPCGLMDQLACAYGVENHLLPILCQPDVLYEPLHIPEGIHFVGIDSGVKHEVSGDHYADVRAAAFMGYSIIAQSLSTSMDDLKKARKQSSFQHLPYKGYLANVAPWQFEQGYQDLLPEVMKGEYFLEHYKLTIDSQTEIEPSKYYQVKAATKHPILENFRIGIFRQLLSYYPQAPDKKAILKQLGELMFLAHTSYNACGLGHPITDILATTAWTMQRQEVGIYGARITGGGSGGTVCMLCEGERGLEAAHSIFENHQRKTGKKLVFLQ